MEGNNMPRFAADLGCPFTGRPLIERFGAAEAAICCGPEQSSKKPREFSSTTGLAKKVR
jgi:hypothetical protein